MQRLEVNSINKFGEMCPRVFREISKKIQNICKSQESKFEPVKIFLSFLTTFKGKLI